MNCATLQTPLLHCAQDIDVVHEHLAQAEKAQAMRRIIVIPTGKGAIQPPIGASIPEDRMRRMEDNICSYVAVATRLHPEVVDVAYGQTAYRPEVDRDEEMQYWYSTQVSEEAFQTIMSKGEQSKDGAPGWSKAETGVLEGAEDQYVVVHGTMIQMFQPEGSKEEVQQERKITALVIDAEM